MSDEIERLQALSVLQTADINALFLLVRRLEEMLRPNYPDMPDLADLFLQLRKEQLQQHLEAAETKDPAFAARLQQMIDESCTIFPPTYD
jgi:site-specific recombinase